MHKLYALNLDGSASVVAVAGDLESCIEYAQNKDVIAYRVELVGYWGSMIVFSTEW